MTERFAAGSGEEIRIETDGAVATLAVASGAPRYAALLYLGPNGHGRVGDGVDHFDADTSPHYHFVCSDCGNVIDLDMDSIDYINQTAAKNFNGQITGHITYFYGLCPHCKEKKLKALS